MNGTRRTFPELPDWEFEIEEVSAAVYRVTGVDQAGRSVESTGTDPDSLLSECRKAAERIQTEKNESDK